MRTPRRPWIDVFTRGALLALAAVALSTAWAPSGFAAAEQRSGWRWPVEPPARIVRAFELPPGPYEPGHRGVDLAVSVGAPIRSGAAGTVIFVGLVASRPVVVVAHGPTRTADELRTTYEPVVAQVKVGKVVQAGSVLGTLGRWPGHCPSSCLHWGLRRGTTYLDPARLMKGRVRLLPVGPPIARPRGGSEPRTAQFEITHPIDAARPTRAPTGQATARTGPARRIDARKLGAAIAGGAAAAGLLALCGRRTPLRGLRGHPRGSWP